MAARENGVWAQMHRWARQMLGTVCVAAVASGASAQDRRALVVASDAAARESALAVSETLFGLGFDVQRLEAPGPDGWQAALADLAAHDGPVAVHVTGDSLPRDLRTYLAQDVSGPRFVFMDACAPDFRAVARAARETYFIDGCDADVTATVQDRLAVPGLRVDQWALPASSTLSEPFVFQRVTSDVRLTAADYAMLETLSPQARARMIQLWTDAGIPVDVAHAAPVVTLAPRIVADETVVIAPVRPVTATSVISPITPVLPRAPAPVEDIVSILAQPLPASVGLPVPGEGGLPAPSILVGRAPLPVPDAPNVPDDPITGTAFGFEDPETREALRAQDAGLFAGLVETGAFDPPEAELSRALQIELQRINCYTSGIDGAWGPGSRRALLQYYDQIGQSPPSDDATLATYRAIIASDADIRCPEAAPATPAQPVAQAAPRAAAQSQRTATPAPARVAPPPTQTPRVPEQPARRTINQSGGTGVFR